MKAQKFVVLVEGNGDDVSVDVITPDGQLEHCGRISSPAQIIPFAVQFGPMLTAMVTQAFYEVRA